MKVKNKIQATTKKIAPAKSKASPRAKEKKAAAAAAAVAPVAAAKVKAVKPTPAPTPFKNTQRKRLELVKDGVDAFACFSVKMLPASFIEESKTTEISSLNNDRIIIFNGVSNAVKTDGNHYLRSHEDTKVTGSLKMLEKLGELKVMTREELETLVNSSPEERIVHNRRELTGNVIAEVTVHKNRYRVFAYREGKKTFLINLEDKANIYNSNHRYSIVQSKGERAEPKKEAATA